MKQSFRGGDCFALSGLAMILIGDSHTRSYGNPSALLRARMGVASTGLDRPGSHARSNGNVGAAISYLRMSPRVWFNQKMNDLQMWKGSKWEEGAEQEASLD